MANNSLNRMFLTERFLLGFGFILIITLGILDFFTGYEISFSVFYLIPVSLLTWYAGRVPGLIVAAVSAMVWIAADILAGHSYVEPVISIWNAFVRLGFFVVVALLLTELKKASGPEKDLSRIDALTGAVNSRVFFELLRIELNRCRRHGQPFTLAYINVDDFKSVNDAHGHLIGDQALRSLARSARRHLRETDEVARLGGDEFALLLPETDREAAKSAIGRFCRNVQEDLRENGWPVTLSVGVITCLDAPATVLEVVRKADALMYLAKRGGKNAVRYSVYDRGEYVETSTQTV